MGRYTIRSAVNAEIICQAIAEGQTAAQAVRLVGFGNPNKLYDWAREDAEFAVMYARAKEVQADRFAEEIVEISDDGTNDWQKRELESGAIVEVPDHEHINRSRLRVDTRKFLMAKMAPRKYGDRQIVDHQHTIDPSTLGYAELMALARTKAPMIEHDYAATQQTAGTSDAEEE